ncbi:uncharacterized protein [Miscanthus floridulus]|uniref:uncharacterized protein isoform X3 n=1 Tax=Miscanthus floridulus TaxID=154761 RepID=UPI003457EC18
MTKVCQGKHCPASVDSTNRLLRMVDGLNFKDFVAFLSTFSAKASLRQKIELIFKVYDIDGKGKITFKDLLEVLRDLTGSFMSEEQRELPQGAGRNPSRLYCSRVNSATVTVDTRGLGLQPLPSILTPTDSVIYAQVVTKVLEEAGYTRDCAFSLEDFIQIIDHPGLKMEVEVPID